MDLTLLYSLLAIAVVYLGHLYWNYQLAIRQYKDFPGVRQFVPRISRVNKFMLTFGFLFWNTLSVFLSLKTIKKYFGIPPHDPVGSAEYIYKSPNGMISWVTGQGLSVELGDPNLIKEAMITKRDIIDKNRNIATLEKLFGKNVLTTIGDEWKHHREVTNPAFTDSIMGTVTEVTYNNAIYLCNKWDELIGNKQNGIFEVADYTRSLSMNVISQAGFGVPLDTSYNPIKYGTFAWALKNVANGLIMKLALPSWCFKLPINKLREIDISYDIFNKTLHEVMESAKNSPPEERKNILSQLVGSSLSNQEIIGNMFIFYFAGHETTANTLAFTCHLLAKHPEVQAKMLAEVNSVAEGNRELIYSDYTKLPYCRGVFQETLRLYPAAPAITKSCMEDLELGGHKLPKDTMIIFNMYATHRNPKYWKNPEEFMPERFVDGANVPYSFIPFSSGPRTCIGNKFALVEGTIALAAIIRRFSFSLPEEDKADLSVWARGVLLPEKPIKVIATKRL